MYKITQKSHSPRTARLDERVLAETKLGKFRLQEVAETTHWNTNNKIQNYVSKNGLDKGDFLRMNYGFGDDMARDQLDSILDGSTLLEFGGTDGKAQTVLDGDTRVVHLNGYKEGMSLEESAELALLLGHEGHRDGVVSGDNALETRSAVTAHSAMALRI